MDEHDAWLTEASEIWWREVDGCAPVQDAEGEGDEGLFGAPGTGWHYFTDEFRGYLVSPDGETCIGVSELDPAEDVEMERIKRELSEDIFKILNDPSTKIPYTDEGIELVKNVIKERLVKEGYTLPIITVLEPVEEDKVNRIIRWGITYPPTITLEATIPAEDAPLCGLPPTDAAVLEADLNREFSAEGAKFEEEVRKMIIYSRNPNHIESLIPIEIPIETVVNIDSGGISITIPGEQDAANDIGYDDRDGGGDW